MASRDAVRGLLVSFSVALFCLLAFPAEAAADSGMGRAIRRCAKSGLCVFTLDATTTWLPNLPPLTLRDNQGVERGRHQRAGSAFFPIGFALDMRLDTERVFVPLFGVMGAFAPGSSTTAVFRTQQVELSDIKYSTLLLPGLGIHLGDGARVRVSVSARAVYSVLTVSGRATSQKGEVALDGRGVHGWGGLASVEMCRDIIGERRGLCAFVQGTQAYSEGLQHAFSGGLRLVY